MTSQLASAMQQPASRDLHLEISDYYSSCAHSEDSAAALPFAQLLSNAASGGSNWKVQGFWALHCLMKLSLMFHRNEYMKVLLLLGPQSTIST